MKALPTALAICFLVVPAARAAIDVSGFVGEYECPTFLRTAPKMQQSPRMRLKVTRLAPNRVRVTWSEPNFGESKIETAEIGEGIAPGDLEYRSMVNAPNAMPGIPTAQINDLLVSFSKTPGGKVMNFTVNRPELGISAIACMKK